MVDRRPCRRRPCWSTLAGGENLLPILSGFSHLRFSAPMGNHGQRALSVPPERRGTGAYNTVLADKYGSRDVLRRNSH